ncbi:MAG TPA: undecaprenyl-diphosphatase [Lichenihabitans sp.]|jgi:undecaprenyl-diphosphatase|nr:undecaprenyl-diphosphatase [Lichenihabitans sp.]
MMDDLNHRAFLALAARLDLGSAGLLGAHALAQGLVFFAPATLALLWLFGDRRDRRADVAALLTAVVALAVAYLLSHLVVHPRPFMVEPVRNFLNMPSDTSFPSGQATLFFALAVSFAWHRAPGCPWLGLLFLACGIAVGWSRILLGAHYPLDVAGSALIALAAGPIIHLRPGAWVLSRMTALAERLYGVVRPPGGMHHEH